MKTLFLHNNCIFRMHKDNQLDVQRRMDVIERSIGLLRNYIDKTAVICTPNCPEILDLIKITHGDEYINNFKHLKQATLDCLLDPVLVVKTAVDMVFRGGRDSVFCAVRPPGHHASFGGPNIDGNEMGEGFCYFNNVALAAVHAYANYSKKKVLIIDWDFHHGNGTQKIFFDIKCKNESSYSSTKSRDFFYMYKENGNYTIKKRNILNHPDIYFFSVHSINDYPYNNKNKECNIEREKAMMYGEIGNSYLHNDPVTRNYINDSCYIYIFKRLQQYIKDYGFVPDLILISAGFDAMRTEVFGGELTPQIFSTLTEIVKRIAINSGNNPPIISILEGGYNVCSINGFHSGLVEHVKALSTYSASSNSYLLRSMNDKGYKPIGPTKKIHKYTSKSKKSKKI